MFDVDVVGDDAGDPVGDEEDIAVGERGVDGVAELQVFQERLNCQCRRFDPGSRQTI